MIRKSYVELPVLKIQLYNYDGMMLYFSKWISIPETISLGFCKGKTTCDFDTGGGREREFWTHFWCAIYDHKLWLWCTNWWIRLGHWTIYHVFLAVIALYFRFFTDINIVLWFLFRKQESEVGLGGMGWWY